MTSTGRAHPSLSHGNYEKELLDLKALLQKTLEELKACCSAQQPKSDDHVDPDASPSDQTSGGLLEDVTGVLSEIMEDQGRRTSTSSDGTLRRLHQAVEEDRQQYVALLRGTHESTLQARQMHHSEVLNAIQQSRADQGHRSR